MRQASPYLVEALDEGVQALVGVDRQDRRDGLGGAVEFTALQVRPYTVDAGEDFRAIEALLDGGGFEQGDGGAGVVERVGWLPQFEIGTAGQIVLLGVADAQDAADLIGARNAFAFLLPAAKRVLLVVDASDAGVGADLEQGEQDPGAVGGRVGQPVFGQSPGLDVVAAPIGQFALGGADPGASAKLQTALEVLDWLDVTLPDHLADAAQLRLAHPTLSLEQLAKIADPPTTKDAIAGRLLNLADTHTTTATP
ncbi:helix-turn-helix domain-containing protein [Actinomadura rudentiformis]|uniref:helix-turn-helix domain-containing protein n=1 Tax=Actinomadura rudentiformis TaxID=359158 RepID=UPI0029901EEF|nr:helix-turn-helix domain-containing protein [Actinomadura rudentiformis]